jgi:flagellar motor switch/type III secretory pathway protein FliN
MIDSNEIDKLVADTANEGDASLLAAAGDAEPLDDPEPDSEIKGLPVTLEVSLPAVTVSLDMVRSMARGVTVPLGIDLTERVRIGINGRQFGEGTFVQIGDRIGIQIEDWKPGRSH